jgi:hypothetical protein
LAIAAWLLARYDTAEAVASHMRTYQDPETGGIDDHRPRGGGDKSQDLLKTAQFGISALVMGDRNAGEGVFRWLKTTYQLQPDLPHRLYPSRIGNSLITTFPREQTLLRVVDFEAPRQLYFHPGIAAAFLGGWSQQTRDASALQLGRDYLALSTRGTEEQFTDLSSVQICKFGWGAAAMLAADPTGGHLSWAIKMMEWFCDRQRPDGSWAPSSFMTPEPQLLDHYWKTAEHTMELCYLESAIRAHVARAEGI